MFVLVDTGLQYMNMYINKWYAASKIKALAEAKKKSAQSKSVIRKKVTSYKGK